MTDQVSALAGQTFSPERRLTLRFDRNTQPELGLKDGISPSAQNEVDAAASLEEELQCPFGQGLCRRPCDCEHIGVHAQTSLRVTGITPCVVS